MSKGSKARPYSVSFDEFDENFNRVFRQVRLKEILEDSAVEMESFDKKQSDSGKKEILSETPQ